MEVVCHVGLKLPLRLGFINFSTTDIWGQIVFCCGHCPVHYRILSNIPNLYPLDVSSTLSQVCQPRMFPDTPSLTYLGGEGRTVLSTVENI